MVWIYGRIGSILVWIMLCQWWCNALSIRCELQTWNLLRRMILWCCNVELLTNTALHASWHHVLRSFSSHLLVPVGSYWHTLVLFTSGIGCKIFACSGFRFGKLGSIDPGGGSIDLCTCWFWPIATDKIGSFYCISSMLTNETIFMLSAEFRMRANPVVPILQYSNSSSA